VQGCGTPADRRRGTVCVGISALGRLARIPKWGRPRSLLEDSGFGSLPVVHTKEEPSP
jgi:hypothetical protein